MAKINKKEFKNMSKEDLQKKLIDLKKELIKENAQIAVGTTPKSPGQVKQMKKAIATIIQLLQNKEVKKTNEWNLFTVWTPKRPLCLWNNRKGESNNCDWNWKRKFGKLETTIEGIDSKEIDIKDLAKQLKSKFACGGTVKDGKIELQGDHKQRVKEFLIQMGFAANTIEVKQRY